MDELGNLYKEKKEYINLKNNIESIIEYLNFSVENLEIPANEIKDSFIINEEQADNQKIYEIREALKTKINYLNNTILVNIDSQIYNLNNKIATDENNL